MRISQDGIRRIVLREGVVLHMYRDSAGLPTICAGHLLTKDEWLSGKVWIAGQPVHWWEGLTPAQADTLLDQDLDVAEGAVNSLVTAPLNQAQYDTLVSFVFNVGRHAFAGSTLLKRLNFIPYIQGTGENPYAVIPLELRRWKYSGGQVDPILVNRREQEIRQWEGR